MYVLYIYESYLWAASPFKFQLNGGGKIQINSAEHSGAWTLFVVPLQVLTSCQQEPLVAVNRCQLSAGPGQLVSVTYQHRERPLTTPNGLN